MCDLITVPVSKPYLLMSDASPVEGSTMWMRCSLENGTGPIQYVWKHETRNGNISVFAEGNTSVINVTNVNRNHTGWYRCVASNAVNSESSNRLWLDTICEYFWRFKINKNKISIIENIHNYKQTIQLKTFLGIILCI